MATFAYFQYIKHAYEGKGFQNDLKSADVIYEWVPKDNFPDSLPKQILA